MDQTLLDSVIIGGGPAGLTAAIYLARFRRQARLIDGGSSRAALVPVSHNLPGYPEGIEGPVLLSRMTQQALRYGVEMQSGMVSQINREPDGNFAITVNDNSVRSRTVLLAMGVLDVEPDLPDLEHAVQSGLVRYCPVCDGFEIIDRKLAVIEHGAKGLKEAMFLRTFSREITLLSADATLALSPDEAKMAEEAGITVLQPPIASLAAAEGRNCFVTLQSGEALHFDAIYSALGTNPRVEIVRPLGLELADQGCIVTSSHQQTSMGGIFAAGDIVRGLNQISVAMGEAAIAATAIHNLLRGEEVR